MDESSNSLYMANSINSNFSLSFADDKNNYNTLDNLIGNFSNIPLPQISRSLASSKTQQEKADEEANMYEMLMFGDIGMIDYFFNTKSQNKLTNEEIFQWDQNFISKENYYLTNYSCIMKRQDDISLYNHQVVDFSKEQGLENFKSLTRNKHVKAKIASADNVAILGDFIYVESRNLLINKKLISLDKWLNRLECAWNLLLRSLEETGLVIFLNESDTNSNSKNNKRAYLSEKMDLLPGNHDLEVDIFFMEKLYTDLVNLKQPEKIIKKGYTISKEAFGDINNQHKIFTYTPKFISINFKEFKIEILDFNSALIFCLDKYTGQGYFNCQVYNSFISYIEAKKYAGRVFLGLNKFTSEQNQKENFKIWKVVRTHISPFDTIEGDIGLFYKLLPFVIENYVDVSNRSNELSTSFIILEEMEKNGVNIMLVAHIHQSAVIAYPYARKFYRKKEKLNYISKDPKCPNPSVTMNSNLKESHGCLFRQNKSIFENELQYSRNCDNSMNYVLPIPPQQVPADAQINRKTHNLNFLYIFVTGNSGGDLNNISFNNKINAFLLWSRVMKLNDEENLGFSTAKFYKDKLDVEFFEVIKHQTDKIIKVAKFTFQSGSIPNSEYFVKKLEESCLNPYNADDSSCALTMLLFILFFVILFWYYNNRWKKNKLNKQAEMNNQKFNLL